MRIPLLIACVLVCAGADVASAAVYRCPDGSFQDKPCEKGDSKVITKRNTAGKPKPPEDACAALGQEATDIAKARTEGMASEKLLGDVDKEGISRTKKLERKKLIVDVYQKTGSPQAIGIVFEADCLKSREAAKKQVPAQAPAVAAPRVDAAADSAASAKASAGAAEAQKRAAEDKKRQCDELGTRRDSVMAQQRAGGNIKAMESLNRTRQDIDKQISAAGCT